ncbi:PH domain-containing protein [Kitasatospora sp. NPDC053057]|uniref:PH domain-containing protein n=1 Tax=Kitasatospora sp. NPDC053057 TaxID=3364062 RepID=UPI0037C8F366
MVRLWFMQQRGEFVGVGSMVGLAVAILLVETGTTDGGAAFLALAAIVAVAAFALPHAYWLRADEDGLTLVRSLVPRRYAWADIRGLAMELGRDAENDGHHLTLRLRLADPPGRFWGPRLGRIDVTEEDTPEGVPRRALAELFAVFVERELPVDLPEFANEVLRVRGLPQLPPLPLWAPPEEGAPTPEQAYADAPGIEDERGDLVALGKAVKRRVRLSREYLLRRAALADRVFLRDGDGLALAIALGEAERLAEHDGIRVEGDQRHYVREQYLSYLGRRTLNP